MEKLNKILVIFDKKHETQTAMLRALELSRLTEASIHIIATIHANFHLTGSEALIETEQLLQESIQTRLQHELGDYIDSLDAAGIDISYETLWSTHPHQDIAELCEQHCFDLLIKTANQHRRFEGFFHTPLDWHLLRECPCPVLLVSEEKWPEGSSMIAAIDANSDDETHLELNAELLKTATFLGQLLGNEIYVANACAPLPVLVDLEYTTMDPANYIDNLHDIARKKCIDIIEPYGIDAQHIKIIDGNAEDVIPKLADTLDSRLIILGTVSRSGLKGYIMGNTAELLLHNLHCDVLALKPEGFHYNP